MRSTAEIGILAICISYIIHSINPVTDEFREEMPVKVIAIGNCATFY